MYSLDFPNMFTSSRTKLISDRDAIKSNLLLLLKSHRTGLFGDPYFGTALQKVIYSQNNGILADLVIDEIYTSIKVFMPNVSVKREDIRLNIKNDKLYCEINARYLLDNTMNLYSINLTDESSLQE